MKRCMSCVVLVLAVSALASACGGAEQSPKAPESGGGASKSSAPPPAADAQRPTSVENLQPAPPTPSTGMQYAQPPPQPGQPGQPGGTQGDPWIEFQSARGQFDATTSDCAVACKALASIDRATGHVCGMAAATDHCSSARETLKAARRKVRAECTICPGGASVDPDAPIPSVP
jgi:hypothetical protein